MRNEKRGIPVAGKICIAMIIALIAAVALSVFNPTIVTDATITAQAHEPEIKIVSTETTDEPEDEITSKGDIITAMLAGKNICYILAENSYMSAIENNHALTSLERVSVFDRRTYKKYVLQIKHLSPIKPKYAEVNDPNSPLMGTGDIPDDMKEEEQVPDEYNDLIELDASEPGYKTNESPVSGEESDTESAQP